MLQCRINQTNTITTRVARFFRLHLLRPVIMLLHSTHWTFEDYACAPKKQSCVM